MSKKKMKKTVMGALSAASSYVGAVTGSETAKKRRTRSAGMSESSVDGWVVSSRYGSSSSRGVPEFAKRPWPPKGWEETPEGKLECQECGKKLGKAGSKNAPVITYSLDWLKVESVHCTDCSVTAFLKDGHERGHFAHQALVRERSLAREKAKAERKAREEAEAFLLKQQEVESEDAKEEKRLLKGKSSFYPSHVKTRTQRRKFVAGLMGRDPADDQSLEELRQELVQYWRDGNELADPETIDVDRRVPDIAGVTAALDKMLEEDSFYVTEDEDEEEGTEDEEEYFMEEDSEDTEDDDFFITD